MASHRKIPEKNPEAPVFEFDAEAYEQHQRHIAVIMGRFMLQHLNNLYQEFDGDIVLAIILGEIAHHNISSYFSGDTPIVAMDKNFWGKPEPWLKLFPCNAFSISEATGIPRETVRRKIAILIEKGWVQFSSGSQVVITKAIGTHFYSDFNVRLCRNLLEAAHRISDLLKTKSEASNDAKRE